jgi:Ca2+/Na+ antiporter
VRHRPSLAVGNVVGSAISNILGAFPLGLIFHKQVQFDRSSRIYSLVLLVLTTCITPTTYFSHKLIWLVCGAIFIAFFTLYIASVGWAILKGALTAPEGSDDDSDDESSADEGSRAPIEADRGTESFELDATRLEGTETSPAARLSAARPKRQSLRRHIAMLLFGFLAICLAGYVLSHAATSIIDQLGMSDVLFGVVILALATTIPEKFVAVLSGHRGHPGILVANTAGSNIFLLSLCLGIIMLDTSGEFVNGNVSIPELGILWASTLAFTVTVWAGGRFSRLVGAAMLVCYVAFIILEFTVIHAVEDG